MQQRKKGNRERKRERERKGGEKDNGIKLAKVSTQIFASR